MNFYQKDNFFTKEESNFIDEILFNKLKPLPLKYSKDQCEGDNLPLFFHNLICRQGIQRSEYTPFFINIFKRFVEEVSDLKGKNILRSCINLTLPFVGKPKLHEDHYQPHYQVIMYLNNSTGTTDIYENNLLVKRVEPKKGRVIMFDKHQHAANSPKGINELRAVCVTTFNT